jgi:hypothetical protein
LVTKRKTRHLCGLYVLKFWRRGSESNRRIKVLQTSPLPLGYRAPMPYVSFPAKKSPSGEDLPAANKNLERETGVEPATSTLARSRSTTELLPLVRSFYSTGVIPANSLHGRSWCSLDFLLYGAILYCVILSAAAFQAKRRISVLSGLEREPKCTTTLRSVLVLRNDSYQGITSAMPSWHSNSISVNR